MSNHSKTIMVDDKRIQLTNLNKIFWPEEKYTKGDLIEYYKKISDTILPYLKNRPQALNRHPNGITGHNFFQKNINHLPPDWAKTQKIYSESGDKLINYIICQDKPTLLYLANLGCIELNVWNSRLTHLERPDYMVLDLDPEDIEFEKVLRVAGEIHKLFSEIGIRDFGKTSGGRGFHIYVPFGARYSHEQTQQFAKLIATIVNKRLPEMTSLKRSPKKRIGKVYLDYLQNGRGKTLAAPYCLRPKPGAPVSTPVFWEELENSFDPSDFNIHSIHERLKKVGDPWKKIPSVKNEMEKAVRKLEKYQK